LDRETMQVRYERPLPDLSFRVSAPLTLDLGGGLQAVAERWSLEGIEPPDGLTGSEGSVRIVIPFHGFEIAFHAHLRRDDAAGLLRFVDLGEREARVLRHFYRELVTGRAVAMERMILAMDAPAEPVPMEQTAQEAAAARRAAMPRPLRAAAVVALYAGLVAMIWQPLLVPVAERAQAHLSAEAHAAGPEAR
jgi:hypothetical protein